jgi:hypothetical protein
LNAVVLLSTAGAAFCKWRHQHVEHGLVGRMESMPYMLVAVPVLCLRRSVVGTLTATVS